MYQTCPNSTFDRERGATFGDLVSSRTSTKPPESKAGSEWREVPGWPAYQVSADGRVCRSLQSKGARGGRVLKPSFNRTTGYHSVCLSAPTGQKRVDVHRLVAFAFIGHPPSSRHHVAHNDGNRLNNTVANLRWATQSENLSDCRRHGTAMIGSKNHSTSLSELDVQAIRHMKRFGVPRAVIADGYRLHIRQVFRILAHECWGHVA